MLTPISWGTTYITITELLPDGRPLLVATLRVLPAGLVLVLLGSFASKRSEHRRDGALWRRRRLVKPTAVPQGTAGSTKRQTRQTRQTRRIRRTRRTRVYRLPGGVAAAAGGLQPLLVATPTWLVSGRRPRAADLVVGVVAAVDVTIVVIRPGAGFAYLSLAATALAFVLWTHGVRRLPSAAPPLLGLAAPTTGAALGWVLLGESLSPLQLLGFAITLGAVARGATLRPTAASPPRSPQAGRVMQVTAQSVVSVSRTKARLRSPGDRSQPRAGRHTPERIYL